MSVGLLLVVMVLATYRLTRLVTEDAFPPVLWLRDRLAGGWRPLTPAEWDTVRTPAEPPFEVRDVDDVASRYVRRWRWAPQWLADLVSCAWCASGWVAAAVTAGTWATAGLPVPLLVWLAVWAGGALIAAQEWA